MPTLRSAYRQIQLRGWNGLTQLWRDNFHATSRCLRLKLDLQGTLKETVKLPTELRVEAGDLKQLDAWRRAKPPDTLPEDFFEDGTHGLRLFYLGYWNGELAHIFWLATADDATTVSNWRPAAAEVEMRNAHTLRAYRNRGIFQQVTRVALQELRKQGVLTVYAHVDEDNLPSRRCFQQLGFVSVEQVLIRRVLGIDWIQCRSISTNLP